MNRILIVLGILLIAGIVRAEFSKPSLPTVPGVPQAPNPQSAVTGKLTNMQNQCQADPAAVQNCPNKKGQELFDCLKGAKDKGVNFQSGCSSAIPTSLK